MPLTEGQYILIDVGDKLYAGLYILPTHRNPVPMRSLGSATIMFGSSAATALSPRIGTPSWQAPLVGPGYRTGDLAVLALGVVQHHPDGAGIPHRLGSIVPFRPGRIRSICWKKACILSEVFRL